MGVILTRLSKQTKYILYERSFTLINYITVPLYTEFSCYTYIWKKCGLLCDQAADPVLCWCTIVL